MLCLGGRLGTGVCVKYDVVFGYADVVWIWLEIFGSAGFMRFSFM